MAVLFKYLLAAKERNPSGHADPNPDPNPNPNPLTVILFYSNRTPNPKPNPNLGPCLKKKKKNTTSKQNTHGNRTREHPTPALSAQRPTRMN